MRHPTALKNVTFDGTLNVNATQYLDIGGISKNNAGTIENCVSRVNINVDGAKVRVGGIVSQNVGTVKTAPMKGIFMGRSRKPAVLSEAMAEHWYQTA